MSGPLRIRDFVVPIGVIAIISCMILPIPPGLLDFLLVGNLILALVLLISALYITEPLKLSALPTLLLLATLYRLSLNISTTRLILGTGDAGKAVEAFGSVVIQGNLVVGAVVFLIITLVQFIVIAKGSERVAEVSARFTLDALPGKQMSIDADVRAGLIDPETAKQKRQDLQAESRFYGALDGAMKFVKGDAIAGLVITAVNIVGGLIVGVVVQKLGIFAAISRYTLLTVGEGLLAQIPALLNSVAAGIIVTRVNRGDSNSVSTELLSQLGQSKQAKILIGITASLLGFIPGMPHLPFFVLSAFMIFLAVSTTEVQENIAPIQLFNPKTPPTLVVSVGEPLLPIFRNAVNLNEEIDRFRQRIYDKTGLVIARPVLEVKKDGNRRVDILMRGIVVKRISEPEMESDPVSAIMNFLEQIVCENRVELIDDILTRRIIDHFDAEAPELVSSVIPTVVTVTQLTEVLKALAKEGLSIRNFDLILQAIAENGEKVQNHRLLLEEVRAALRRVITQKYALDGETIKGFTVDSVIDLEMTTADREGRYPNPDFIEQVFTHIAREERTSEKIMFVSKGARRILSDILEAKGISIPVLSFDEISPPVKFESIGHICFNEEVNLVAV